MDVRLPAIVANDGFFTSHQKRRVYRFAADKDLQDFVGPYKYIHSSVDPNNPTTFGPYMNDPDQINNKKQLSLAMAASTNVIDAVYAELLEVKWASSVIDVNEVIVGKQTYYNLIGQHVTS